MLDTMSSTPDAATPADSHATNAADPAPQATLSPVNASPPAPVVGAAPPLDPAGLPPPSSQVRAGKPPSGKGRKPMGRPRNTETVSVGEPPAPFSGGPPVDTNPTPQAPDIKAMMVMAPESIVGLAIVAIEGAVQAVATWRYGEIEGKSLRATADAKAELHAALLQYIKAAGVTLTPGQAIVAAVAGAYGPGIIQRELEGKARRGPLAKVAA